MATMVNVHEKMSLSDILARVSLGKEILIAQAGKLIARLTPIYEKKAAPRMPGSAVGELVVPPDFDSPLPESILEAFEQ